MSRKYGDIEILKYQDIIFCDQKRRTREEMVFEFGEQATEFAEILESLAEWASRPRPLSTPRRIFISYRHGNEQSNNWVRNVVVELRALGNHVEFDNDEFVYESTTIPQFVGKLAGCHYFLYVIDPGYIKRIESSASYNREHGWASSEFRIARSIGELLRMPLAGLLREGDKIPKGMHLIADQRPGQVYDVRKSGQLLEVLRHCFSNTLYINEEKTKDAAKLVYDSEMASEAGEDYKALDLAARAVLLVPEAVETQQQFTITSLWLNELSLAAKAATNMLKLDNMRFVS